jgi:aldose 1-epimerase
MIRGAAVLIALMVATVPAATMARYSARQNDGVVVLQDDARQTSVAIVPSVGNIAFEMKVNGENVLYWPYASIDEFKSRPAMSAIPFVGPWVDRLDEPAFFANGRRYAFDLDLGNVRGDMPSHGFLTTTDRWNPVEVRADEDAAWATSRLEFYRYPMWTKQWPFAHTIEITHRLHDGVLEVQTTIVNLSAEAMPIAIGFHPYFQLTDSPRDEWTLSVGAKTHWVLNAYTVPTGATEPIERFFPTPGSVPLREYGLDDVFSDLARDDQGHATVSVIGKSQRLDIVVGANYRAVTLWSPRDRRFICVEPTAGIINALNLAARGLYPELQSVAPRGGMWRESFWIKASGFN